MIRLKYTWNMLIIPNHGKIIHLETSVSYYWQGKKLFDFVILTHLSRTVEQPLGAPSFPICSPFEMKDLERHLHSLVWLLWKKDFEVDKESQVLPQSSLLSELVAKWTKSFPEGSSNKSKEVLLQVIPAPPGSSEFTRKLFLTFWIHVI